MEERKSDQDTARRIAESAELQLAPDGERYPVIDLKTTLSISLENRVSMRHVETTALRQGVVPCRYLRNIGTIGVDGQLKLLESTVAIVGAGGLGGTAIELLARLGAGHLIIIDDGRFADHNLNRQLMSAQDNVGERKVTVAASRVSKVNCAVEVTAFGERLTNDNASRLLRGARAVVDGLDNLSSRFAVEHACRDLGIPYVYGTIAGFCGQLMTIYPGDPGLSCIYGSCRADLEQGMESATGNPATTPALVAALQVQESVKIITGIGTPLRNRVLMVDVAHGTFDALELTR